MEKFQVTVLKLIENHLYVHCFDLGENIIEENEIYDKFSTGHIILNKGDIILLNSELEEDMGDYMVLISGTRRAWKLLDNEEMLHPISLKWWLPESSVKKTLFGKDKRVYCGLAISTRHGFSEQYELLRHKSSCTIIKHRF